MSMNRLKFTENIRGGFSNNEAIGKLPSILPSPLRLNLGCGKDIKEGWMNIDLFSEYPIVIKMDIRNIELDDNSVDEILASDILEHFSHREVDAILSEWARVLKPNGIIEIRCPNLKLQLQAYMRGDWNADIASYMIFGGQTNPGDYHCVAFDKESITNHLTKAGFSIISYDEHDFPQEKGFINLNMTVKAKKNDNTFEYVDDAYSGLDFTLESESISDIINEIESESEELELFQDDLFDIDLLEEIVNIDKIEIEKETSKKLNIIWEGSQFVYHSLAGINREICLNLSEINELELTIVPYENDRFHHSVDERYKQLLDNDIRYKKESDEDISKLPYLWVRHTWPPKKEAPNGSKWVIMQPWEYSHFVKDFIDTFKYADEIWTPSNYSRQAFINSGIDFDKVQVIPNGINPEIFKPFGDKYDLGTDKKLKLLFVGGTIFRKGIDILLKAYTKIFSKNDDIVLIIKDLGSSSFYAGQTANNIIAKIQNNVNAPEIIHIEDELSENELANLYRSCDVFVSPYRGEGFSMPTLEAMACGLPIVVTKGGATDDYVNDSFAWLIESEEVEFGETLSDLTFTEKAFVLEPNEESLALTLRSIYEKPSEIISAGLLASLEARTNRTWKKSALKILQRIDYLYDTDIAMHSKEVLVDKYDAYIYVGLGEKYYTEGNPEESFEYFKIAIESEILENKDAIHSLNRMAVITLNRGNIEEAEKYLNLGKMIDSDHPDLLYIQTLLHAAKNEIVEALETIAPLMENWSSWKYDSCFGINLDDLLVLTGDLLLNMGDLESANQIYTSALELNHENAFACYGAGMCFLQAGLDDSAKEMLNWAVKIMPDFELAEKALNEIS